MSNFWMFWSEHWFLAWCALWLCWPVVALPSFVINRVLRTIKVVCRGWPPAHLDADGDWRPEEKK